MVPLKNSPTRPFRTLDIQRRLSRRECWVIRWLSVAMSVGTPEMIAHVMKDLVSNGEVDGLILLVSASSLIPAPPPKQLTPINKCFEP
jgi:hypothetical protein